MSLGVLAVLAAAAAVYTTRAVLVRVLIALFIAVSLDPAVRALTRRGMRRSTAVLVIFLIACGLTAAFLVSVIPAMVHQFQSLVHDFPGYIASLSDRSARFRQLTDRFHLTGKVQDLIAGLPGKLGGGLLGFTRRLFGALFDTLTVLVIFLVAGGLAAAFLVSVIPAMVHQFQSLVHDFPGYIASLSDRSARFRQLTDRFHLTSKVQDLLASLPGRLGGGVLGFTRRLFGALFDTLTVVVLAIYFMADMPRLRHNAMRLFPRAHRVQAGRVADVMVDKVGSYMIGNLLISLAAGLASFAVFAALGMPFAVPLAFAVAVCDLIPMIGATLGAVICVLAALLTTELWPTTVVVAIFFVVYQQVENYFIAPRILRSTVSLSAAAVLLAGLIGGTVLGLIGALMAIPVAAGLKVVLAERLQVRDSADAGPADAEPADSGPGRLRAGRLGAGQRRLAWHGRELSGRGTRRETRR